MKRREVLIEDIPIKRQKSFKVYEDSGDNYSKPERVFENDVLKIRLYCEHPGCNKYIIGLEYYNGRFIAETGHISDLRNQCFICDEHK